MSITNAEVQSAAMTLAQQYRQEGLQKLLVENLRVRLGSVPLGLVEAITAIHDEDHLLRLHRASLDAASLEEFTAAL
jgi:hypothetical protein